MSTTNLKTGEATAGSIWNKNSWHWEEKDYNKVAKALIKEQLESLELVLPSGEQIKMKAVEPKGFCSISVRKGKKVIIFEFAINMEFVCGSNGGVVKLPEFSNDELDPVIRVEMKSENDSLKDFMRKTGADAIRRALGRFLEFINTVDTGSDVLTSDKERREIELELARKAEQEKGEEKKKIAEQVKEKERAAIAGKDLAEASVWNVNSYHWETRNLFKWADEWIRSQLITSPDFGVIEVKGEAENSIRKGKKISVFNLNISGEFKSCDFQVPCFSNEGGDDEIPKVKADSAIQKEIVSELTNRVFNHFLTQMKTQ